jgi:hypothetical protein
MHRLQFNLVGLFIAFLLLAVSLAAILSGSPMLASAVFTANLLLLSLALVGAFHPGPRRMFWIGFAVFGSMYTLSAFGLEAAGLRWYSRPQLITSHFIDLLLQFRTPLYVGAKVEAQWNNGSFYRATIREYNGGLYRVGWDDGSTDSWVASSQIRADPEVSDDIGHAIIAPFFGWIGGWVSALVFGAGRTRPFPSVPVPVAAPPQKNDPPGDSSPGP